MEFSKSLKLNHLFRRLYRKGQSAANGYLVLYCRRNGSQTNRIGLTVSAKLGHAVVRNKLRRRLLYGFIIALDQRPKLLKVGDSFQRLYRLVRAVCAVDDIRANRRGGSGATDQQTENKGFSHEISP